MIKIVSTLTLATVLLFCFSAIAADKVVVIPLGGKKPTGDAVAKDVLDGKTFSNKVEVGIAGSLKVRSGGTIYTNSIGMDFSLIPAGSFTMGSPDGTNTAPAQSDELGRNTVETQHIVTISEPFYMQTTEVTQGQWQQVMNTTPSNFTACGLDCPVEQVSWDDAQLFIDTLNNSEGRTNCDTILNTCYSLPTESQWEYAARAGTVTAFYNGDIVNIDCSPLDSNLDSIGWYCGNAGSTTHPVAQKTPNNWGLYDMSGNVYEWCEDFIGIYPTGPVTDPTGAAPNPSGHVGRGGYWGIIAGGERSAARVNFPATIRLNLLGFRLALSPIQ